MSNVNQLAARVFATRDITHKAHLKTQSYAAHMALGDFYDAIIDHIDEIVEVYQGKNGLINIPSRPAQQPPELIPWLKDEAAWIEENRQGIANGMRAIENLVDELVATYYRTIYKLENLG